MNEFDGKLKEIVTSASTIGAGMDDFGAFDKEDQTKMIDETVAQIKQAFEDAGYVQMKGTVTGNSTNITYAIKAQSREEWLASQSDMHPEVK